nr:hypothetical protein [Candidatus Sigynarchaeota archaeon]
MKRTKIFSLNRGLDKAEAEINTWLAQNSEKKIVSTAGTNAYLIIIYDE